MTHNDFKVVCKLIINDLLEIKILTNKNTLLKQCLLEKRYINPLFTKNKTITNNSKNKITH